MAATTQHKFCAIICDSRAFALYYAYVQSRRFRRSPFRRNNLRCYFGRGPRIRTYARAANLLSNPGFETGTFAGWTLYGANDYVMNSSAIAHSGSYYFKVYQVFNGQTNYNGIYQDTVSGPGATYSADGWAYTLSSDALAGTNLAWLEVSFHDVSGNMLALYRSAIVSTNAIAAGAFLVNTWVDLRVTNQYNPNTFLITNTVSSLIAPPATSFVRYQIVFQGDQFKSGGSMYFDDVALNQPAPRLSARIGTSCGATNSMAHL